VAIAIAIAIANLPGSGATDGYADHLIVDGIVFEKWLAGGDISMRICKLSQKKL
jgi:hypothetical protein